MRQQEQEPSSKKKKRKNQKRVRLVDFTCIEEPHPYGVLPGGNRFFGSSSSSPSSSSSSSSVSSTNNNTLSDNLWQQIISFCDGSTTGRLIQVNRYLYVIGHQPELWRDLVLRKCQSEKLTISNVGPSWKDTYVLLTTSTLNDDDHNNNNNNNNNKYKYIPHQPIRMTGIYSDDIYRSHLCRSFALPSVWLQQQQQQQTQTQTTTNNNNNNNKEVDTVDVDDMTSQQFFTQYEERNRPVVIKGAANGKASEKWKNWNYLMNNSKHCNSNSDNDIDTSSSPTCCSSPSLSTTKIKTKSYRATSGGAPLPGNFTLEAYHDYTQDTNYLEESPLYLFDRNAFTTNKEWENDFFPEFHRKCSYWDPSSNTNGKCGHDLLQHLGNDKRPDHTWLIVGPKRSGSVFHIDPNATHAWNACITGRKRWILYPPGQPPPGVFPSADMDEVALPLSVGEWIIQYWTEHIEQYRTRPVDQRPLECTTHPGDVVFVPHGWWHSVINLDDSNIAITHNYASPSNLGNVLRFFVDKQDQISGCRDRKESIKPEYIHDELVKVLKIKEPKHLEKALQQTGWTCRAWDEGDNKIKVKLSTRQQQDDENENEDNINKKRRTSAMNGERDDGKKQELTSVMSKTDTVSTFSFSFL